MPLHYFYLLFIIYKCNGIRIKINGLAVTHEITKRGGFIARPRIIID